MTRDEIYDHLAQVYLGKRGKVEPPKPKVPSAWLVINIAITAFILTTVVYGFTAFLARRDDLLRSRVISMINSAPIRMAFNVSDGRPQVSRVEIPLTPMDVSMYSRLNMSVRSAKGGNPGMLKVVLANVRREEADHYLQGVTTGWQDYSIPLERLRISDWQSLKEISFVVEAWNASVPRGDVYIDNIYFSN